MIDHMIAHAIIPRRAGREAFAAAYAALMTSEDHERPSGLTHSTAGRRR